MEGETKKSLLQQYDDKMARLKKLDLELKAKEKEPGYELVTLEKRRKVRVLMDQLRHKHPYKDVSEQTAQEKDYSLKAGTTNENAGTPNNGDKRLREDSDDDEQGFWEVVTSSKQKRKARRQECQGSQSGNEISQTAQKGTKEKTNGKEKDQLVEVTRKQLPKYKLHRENDNSSVYKKIMQLEKKYPQARFVIKPNIKGEFILHPKDKLASDCLEKEVTGEEFNLVKLDPAERERKSVVLRYPKEFPLEPLKNYSGVLEAQRCIPAKDKTAITRQVLIKHVGQFPKTLDLGYWGKFELRTYVPEPLRCFKCQRYGHRQERCTYKVVCAICSKLHATTTCMEKLKKQEKVQARCANCKGGHHAWNPICPARNQRLQKAQPVVRPAPPGTFVWGTQENRASAQPPRIVQEAHPNVRSRVDFPRLNSPAQLIVQISNPRAQQAPPLQPKPQRVRSARRTRVKKQQEQREAAPAPGQEQSIPVSELSKVLTTFAEGLAALLGQKIEKNALSGILTTALNVVTQPPAQKKSRNRRRKSSVRRSPTPAPQRTPEQSRHLAARSSTPIRQQEVEEHPIAAIATPLSSTARLEEMIRDVRKRLSPVEDLELSTSDEEVDVTGEYSDN